MSIINANTGQYVSVNSSEDYYRSTLEKEVRTHQLYLVFYVFGVIILVGAMLVNIYRVLKRKIPDYATHRLYGASGGFVFARMFLFTLLYQAISIVGTIFLMYHIQIITPAKLFFLALVVFAVVLFITCLTYKRFNESFSKGAKGE
ncbi:MAG: hypothetical protein RSF41_10145 [Lachnospiraceae bacterium]